MFRPVSVELWLSNKNQVKSCFKPHSRCSPPIPPCFNKVSSDKEVLWQEIGTQECARHYVQMCVRSTFPKVLHIPVLLGEVPIANVGGHWNKKQGEQAHTRHKQHLHH